MQHSPGNKYGENLYVCNGCSKVTGDMPVKAWYDEIDLYDFELSEFTLGTVHFTQVVWKDTKELDIGFSKKGKKFFLVCNYFPPGN
ncbi:Golgi-associated plant pathogenesis-related protein 1-like [Lucilia sericata]|uniref:Golgi-associated plant pathogenesis-related protein 1-like n=1 Tax=Lucilia sericata TaxID=13632 RepID=UPI0018A80582|nr:Golgi-associated plant pathogenesis-related protein 1-like [Lucilia sericata]